jgi:hypothetical protein
MNEDPSLTTRTISQNIVYNVSEVPKIKILYINGIRYAVIK